MECMVYLRSRILALNSEKEPALAFQVSTKASHHCDFTALIVDVSLFGSHDAITSLIGTVLALHQILDQFRFLQRLASVDLTVPPHQALISWRAILVT